MYKVIKSKMFCFQDITGWGENDRGVSYTFGGDIVRSFLKRHDCSLIVRAHQVQVIVHWRILIHSPAVFYLTEIFRSHAQFVHNTNRIQDFNAYNWNRARLSWRITSYIKTDIFVWQRDSNNIYFIGRRRRLSILSKEKGKFEMN